MLIKQADDRASDIETLKSLLAHPAANAEIRKRIEQEIRNISAGAKGEHDVAYEIDFHYGPSSKNWVVIHDLRVEHGGRVAQIDHLLINRFLDVWVCESKRFAEGIAINEQGECSMFWQGRPQGVGSPYEQNAKHIAVLKAIFDSGAVELPKRLGFNIKPSFYGLVVVSKNTRITRPKAKGWWDDGIIKADQVKVKIDKAIDSDNNPLIMAKLVSTETVETVARSLTALHVPASFDWHARFGLPKEAVRLSAVKPSSLESPSSKADKPVRACYSCGQTVEDKVVTFCLRFNKARFGGNVYCMDCQKQIPKPA